MKDTVNDRFGKPQPTVSREQYDKLIALGFKLNPNLVIIEKNPEEPLTK